MYKVTVENSYKQALTHLFCIQIYQILTFHITQCQHITMFKLISYSRLQERLENKYKLCQLKMLIKIKFPACLLLAVRPVNKKKIFTITTVVPAAVLSYCCEVNDFSTGK